jgi:hypothetical protein
MFIIYAWSYCVTYSAADDDAVVLTILCTAFHSAFTYSHITATCPRSPDDTHMGYLGVGLCNSRRKRRFVCTAHVVVRVLFDSLREWSLYIRSLWKDVFECI